MMASNRFRLRHLAQSGHHGAQKALALLNSTDKMLGVILLGNNLVNSAAATLVSVIAIELFGEEKWALGASTMIVTFAILVFSEITPKIIGATHADRLALVLGHILTPLLRLAYPAVWFINLFASGLLRLLRLTPKQSDKTNHLSPEELRSLVLESSHLIPKKHHAILSSLFDLNNITVEDVMTPRGNIEILDLDLPWEEVRAQLATSHHSRLPTCRESLDQLVGILPVRRLLASIGDPEFDKESLLSQLQAPYYIPAEDIIEEFVGDFTTSLPGLDQTLNWSPTGDAIVEGSRSLRDINRMLDLNFPLDGPKTLNGLILEHFQDIPEAGLSIKLNGIAVEILQTRERSVINVRIYRPERE